MDAIDANLRRVRDALVRKRLIQGEVAPSQLDPNSVRRSVFPAPDMKGPEPRWGWLARVFGRR